MFRRAAEIAALPDEPRPYTRRSITRGPKTSAGASCGSVSPRFPPERATFASIPSLPTFAKRFPINRRSKRPPKLRQRLARTCYCRRERLSVRLRALASVSRSIFAWMLHLAPIRVLEGSLLVFARVVRKPASIALGQLFLTSR